MSELSDLYQEVILEHDKNPRNLHDSENADNAADVAQKVIEMFA